MATKDSDRISLCNLRYPYVAKYIPRISECVTFVGMASLEPFESIFGLLRFVMHSEEWVMGNTDNVLGSS